MTNATHFVARSVTSTTDLNWVFLVDWIIVLFASILFLFYFHRIIGKIFTWIVSPIIWKQFKVRISFQAIKISLLSGRVFFKNVTIITRNEMIVIYQGTLSWRYWYRKTRVNQFTSHHYKLNEAINSSLPSRLILEISGMETFIYNRSSAYELLEQRLREEASTESTTSGDPFTLKESFSDASLRNRRNSNLSINTEDIPTRANPLHIDHLDHDNYTQSVETYFLNMLPLEVKINKGSVVVGNDTTPYLFVGYYKELKGSIDGSISNSEYDPYRILHDMKLQDVTIEFKKNVSFKKDSTMVTKAMTESKDKMNMTSKIIDFGKAMVTPFQRRKPAIETHHDIISHHDWKGLTRYMQEFQSLDSIEWESIYEQKASRKEYAKESVVLTAPSASLLYYYDIPGYVPENARPDFSGPDVGNGGSAPKFGADVSFTGLKLTFGPWTTKQVNSLHKMLFPPMEFDSKLPRKLIPGELREYLAFDLQVQLHEDSLIRVPFREESKEDKTSEDDDLRYGWMDINIQDGSSLDAIAYNTPTDSTGFKNSFNATLVKPEITSSVNGALVFKADKHTINADIGFPLEWRGLTKWNFVNTSYHCDIYLLREHVSTISDLIGDFGSGTQPSSDSFKPFIYSITWEMKNYSLYLNVNEENIIDNPIDHDRNRFISFSGDDLALDLNIPMVHQYQKSNSVEFKVSTSYFILSIDHQEWSTYSEFSETNEIGYASDFTINGSYTYYNVLEHGAVDTIIVDCRCKDTTVKVYGFVVKYFMDLKENYFGNLIQFKTYEEYTRNKNLERFNVDIQKVDTSTAGGVDGIPFQTLESVERNRNDSYSRLKNETDFQMTFCVDNGCLVLPCNLYNARSHIALHFDVLDIDLRNNNYYMDLQGDFSEIKGRYIADCDESVIFTNTKGTKDFKPDIYIDQLSLHGLRIFGLPPAEPTYFCRWTFETDGIVIDSEPTIIGALGNAVHSFSTGHSDLENSLGVHVDPVMDILNLNFKTPFINIKLNSPKKSSSSFGYYTFELDLINLSLSVSDQPTTQYNSVTEVIIEEIKSRMILDDKQIFELTTNLKFTNLCQKKNAFHRMLQQSLHLHDNDGSFHRTPWLIPEFQRDRMYRAQYGKIDNSIYLPRVPIPLNSQTAELFINSLPKHVKQKFMDSNGNISKLSTGGDENFNRSDLALYDDGDDVDDSYAHDEHQPTDSLEYFNTLSNLDPECEHDNLTIEMDKISVFVFPGISVAVLDIISKMNDVSMSKVLDELQVQYYMKMKAKVQKSILSLNFHCDLIDVFVAKEIGDNNGISLRCHNVDTTLQRKTRGAEEEKLSLKFNLDKFDFNIYNDRKTMLSFEIFSLSVEHTSYLRKVTNVKLTDFEIDVKLANLNWVVDYLLSLMKYRNIMEVKNTELKRNKRDAKIELLYQLTIISIENSISSEPQCLTAIWNQSKKDSIRRDKNWRILPRLRHILQSVPDEWRENQDNIFKQNLWEAPEDADEILQNIFANIRVWEKRQDDIIDMVFGKVEKLKNDIFHTVSVELHHFQVNLSPFDRAIQIADMKFNLSEGKLDTEISSIAYPLLDTDIETSLDIDFEVKQLMTNLTDIKLNTVEILQAIESIFQVIENFSSEKQTEEFDSAKSIRDFFVEYDKKPLLITLNTNIEYFKHLFEIDRSQLIVQGTNCRLFSSMIKTDKLLSFSLNFINNYFNISVDVDSFNTLEYQMKNFSTTVVNTKPFDDGELVFIVDNEEAEFYLGCEEGELIDLIDTIVYNEYPVVKEITDDISKRKKSSEYLSSSSCSISTQSSVSDSELITDSGGSFLKDNIFKKLGVKASFMFNFVNFTSEINLFHPLVHKLNFNEVHFKVDASELGLQSSYNVNRFNMDIILFSCKYLSTFVRTFNITCDIGYIEDIYLVNISGFLAESRLNFNHKDLVDLIYIWHKNWDDCKDQIEELKEKVEEVKLYFGNEDVDLDVETSNDDNMSVLINTVKKHARIKFSYHLDKMTTWALVSGNTVQLESNNFDLNINSFDDNLKRHLPHGDLLFPSIRMNVILNGSQGSIFNMLDVQLKVCVKNPADNIHLRQRLHITSDYLRLVVKNQLIYECIHAYGHIKELLDIDLRSSKSQSEVNNLETLDTISRFFAVVIEANSACFGWILDVDDTHPGPIIGFEKTSIISNEGSGDVSMKGLYLSVANGPTPETFYPTTSEFNSNNRIYVPVFDLSYTLLREEDVLYFNSKLTGDTVDLKLQTEFFEIGQPLIMAVTSIEEQLSQITANPTRNLPIEINERNVIVKKKERKNVKNVVNIQLKFAGASVLIENQYFITNDEAASLGLRAPTLDVIVGYTHDSSALKKYELVIEAHIGETENKLYCTCVPVIIDIVKSTQRYMRKKNTESNKAIAAQSTSSLDIVSWSEKIDFNFDLKIAPQKLVLNCDPRAQIEAEVFMEGIGFHLTTEHDFLSGVFVINKLGAELKHAFSKVISGSVGLNGIILNTILAPINEVKEVITVGSLDDINGYINIQQLQDLDVFKDLWFPNDLYNSNLEKVTNLKVGNKRTFGQIIRDVTMGSPLPWSIIFYIKKIQGMIDLGVSLGSLNLDADNFKAHSKRSHNWDHFLDLSFNSLSLSLHGKIEGLLKAERIKFQTSISFKSGGGILDIPLVSVGFSVESLISNISIDYHPFFIINGRLFEVKVLNENGIRDKLTASFKMGSFKVYTTAMMASNFVEIYSIGLRISQNIKISYRQTLKLQGGKDTELSESDDEDSIAASMTFFKMVSALQTRIFINIGNFETLIFPSSLLDPQALLFRTGSLNAYFLQDGDRNELNFKLSDVFISLSTFKEKIDLNNVEQLRTNDDAIFVFPNLKISMGTKTGEGNVIKYTYGCQFGDKVDIKWKIGSVYFIHQMWISHATTLRERLSFLRVHSESSNTESENYKESIIESVNFEDKLKDLEMDDEYKYEWIEPPIIETPQLKDLGDATPPLEWFGFHRDKFPILTHKFVILGLKELIREVEMRYSKVLK